LQKIAANDFVDALAFHVFPGRHEYSHDILLRMTTQANRPSV
jgi:hypothetical protein